MMQPSQPASRVVIDRACDRCRRKKAKCDTVDSSCTLCRKASQSCSFEIPAGKRGPKRKRQAESPTDVDDAQVQESSPSFASLDVIHAEQHHGPSPASTVSPNYADPHVQASPYPLSPIERWNNLMAAIAAASPSRDPKTILQQCVQLFFEYLNSFTLLVGEAEARDVLNHVLGPAPSLAYLTNQNFTLVTAICAKVSFFCPLSVFAEGSLVAEIFLAASRSCLASYADEDLENPCADSIAIRYLHSNCLHTSARAKVAWHVFGETIRLVHGMNLHDEASYEFLPPEEADLRRKAFWHVYIGDKSLAVLANRPMSIHRFSFEKGITVAYPSVEQNESIAWFNASIQLWQYSSDLLLRIRQIRELHPSSDSSCQPMTTADRGELTRLHIRFTTTLDEIPVFLRPENQQASGEFDETQRRRSIQMADLVVTYHSLRLYLLQKLEQAGYFHPREEYKDFLLLRQTEIARDMVQALQNAPFWSLQVNGEPCVEKVRLVGATLLAIMHDNESSSPLVARARHDFYVLLDILAQLDSSASDALLRTLQ